MSEETSENSMHQRRFDCSDPDVLRAAVEHAFDYRGDVTLELADGRTIVGYLYDRDWKRSPAKVRVIPAADDSGQPGSRVTVLADEIRCVVFSGRDTAEGKTWENWLRRYAEKKLAGEQANLEPDSGE